MTKNAERLNDLFEELVPMEGKAENLAGELVRATARIGYRFYNDGDHLRSVKIIIRNEAGRDTPNPAFFDSGKNFVFFERTVSSAKL